jgi:hypothetical protein
MNQNEIIALISGVSMFWRAFKYERNGNERTVVIWEYILGYLSPKLDIFTVEECKETWRDIHYSLNDGKNREFFNKLIIKNIEKNGSIYE